MNNELGVSFAQLEPAWSDPVTKYFAHLRYEKHYSEHTLGQYQRQLLQAQHFFADTHSGWLELQADDVRRFAMSLRAKGLNPRTINLKLSCLRAFFRYLKSFQQCEENPALYVKGPKFDKPLPRNLDVDQMHQLLEINDDDPLATRDKAIMELLYSCGLRISELINANLNNLDLAQKEIRVIGKGNKERIVPIGSAAVAALEKWLSLRPMFANEDEPALFVSSRKQRISVRHVRERIRQWGVKQGISAQVHPHKLRHSFASHILESSGDLRAVQELLGHSSLSATQVYTHLDFQHLAKVYDNTHPRAKKHK